MPEIPRSPLLLVVPIVAKGLHTCHFQYLLPPADSIELYYHDSGIDLRAEAMPSLKDKKAYRFLSKAWRPSADLTSSDGETWTEKVQTTSNTPLGLWRRHLLSWAEDGSADEILCPSIHAWSYTRVAFVDGVTMGGYRASVPNVSQANSRMANLDLASMRMLLTSSANCWERVMSSVRLITKENGYRTDPLSFQTALRKMMASQSPVTGRSVLSPADMKRLLSEPSQGIMISDAPTVAD